MNKLLTTLAVVLTLFAPQIQAQISLASGSYSAQELSVLLGASRSIVITDFSLVELDGHWNLQNLGPITITVKGSDCIVFSGYRDHAERMRLAQGSTIVIEEGSANAFALIGTGIAEQRRIKLFPNPVIDRFTISYQGGENLALVQLFSVLGRQLLGQRAQVQETYTLPTSLLPGQYILRMQIGARRSGPNQSLYNKRMLPLV